MKQKTESEYVQVADGALCEVPLIQAAKVIGLEEDELPVIKTDAAWLGRNFKWLQDERNKGKILYESHINDTEDRLIDLYPKVKIKLKKQFKKEMNKPFKHKEVTGFVNSAVILELNHMLDHLGDRPAFLESATLH